MGRVCELSEPINGLARIKFSRAPALGPARTVQVPARPVETGQTRIPSAANPSHRRHPLRSSGEKLASEPGRDRWRRGAAARASAAAQASAAAALVGEEGEAGVAAVHPAATARSSGAAFAPSRRRSAPAGGGRTGGGPHRPRWPPTPSARARHRRARPSPRSAVPLPW
jgi:hypothetical protein